jgi:signal transduction histidine kinase
MRLWPRSIRARDTLLAALLSGVVLSVLGLCAIVLIRDRITNDVLDGVQSAARRVSAEVRAGTAPQPLIGDTEIQMIQVVDRSGKVTNATVLSRDRPPISTLRPPPNERVHDWTMCPVSGDPCLVIEAIRTTSDPDAPVVYAAQELPALVTKHALEVITASIVFALTTLAAWLTWLTVGRTLRPIEAIRAQLSEISVTDLSRRVPQPSGEDEIALLARTANQTLDRLERSVDRQRQFASDASHELRTPIAGLRAELEEALMYPQDTDFKATAEKALQDTDRLEAIVTDLLLLARLGSTSAARETVDLSVLAKGEAPDGIYLEVEPDVSVEGVRMQLVRLLHNLLDNAERYGGGDVTLGVYREGYSAVVTVKDRGPGIPEKERERVFERFTRLETSRSRCAGGTGLGLAIARDIALAHGGTLTIEDSPEGACLVLRLPLS